MCIKSSCMKIGFPTIRESRVSFVGYSLTVKTLLFLSVLIMFTMFFDQKCYL